MVFDERSIARMLEKLREYHSDMSQFGSMSLDQFLAQRVTRYAIERMLFLSIESILDILESILSGRFNAVSDTYEEIIKNSLARNIIPPALYGQLKGIGGFRNVLAHEYLELDSTLVHEGFRKILNVIPLFLDEIENQIAQS